MKNLPRRAQLYIIAVLICGGALLAWYLGRLTVEAIGGLGLLAAAALAAAAQVIKVVGYTERSSYEISWVVFGFVFVLFGPAGALAVITAAYLVEWAWNKQKWYIAAYNIASFGITVAAADVARSWWLAAFPAPTHSDWSWAASWVLASAVFTFINHIFIGLVIWLARGEPVAQNGLLGRLPLMIDFTTFGLGVVAAIIWEFNPLAVLLVLTPLYLIYTTLKIPALQRQTQLDPKTGLYNARYFKEALEKELARAERFDRPVTVVIADMDLLRNINNTYGHLAGDAALISVARTLKKMVREYDVVARFGGEEFAILMPETWPQKALPHIEAIRAAIEAQSIEVSTSPTPIKVTMSFGVAGRERAGESPKDVVHNADIAVYRAKLTGRNRVCVYKKGDVLELGDALHLPIPESSDEVELPPPLPADEPPSDAASARATSPPTAPALPVFSEKPARRWCLNSYLTTLALAAAGLFVWLAPPQVSIDWLGLGLFLVLVLIAEGLSLDIYVRETSVSTSIAPFIAGLLLFGPLGGLVLSLGLALTALIKHRSPLSRFVFNSSNHVIAGMLALGVLQVFGCTYANQPLPAQVLITAAATGLAYFCNTGLVTLAIHFDGGQPIRQIWSERFGWLWPYYLALGFAAFALGWMYLNSGPVGVVIMLAPLLMLRFSQSEYLRRTKDTVTQLKAANSELTQRAEYVAKLNEDLIQALSRVVDLRDPYVQSHSHQVARYAVLMAQELRLPPERIELVRKAGLLHDIGKLSIPDPVLFKPGKLTPEEYRLIQQHSAVGANMLEHVAALRPLMPLIRHHHEHYNGLGYPDGLREQAIPLEARILSVADAVEAMASDRPYRAGLDGAAILAELRCNMGTQFDPTVVRAFERVVKRQGLGLIVNSAHAVRDRLTDSETAAWRRFVSPAVTVGRAVLNGTE
jgi:diguanylate cyclase (GGDEF)-like protein/putative nucleotidyltransferase with HDIG domain